MAGSANAEKSEQPQLQVFQLEGGAASAGQSVNLFRGNLTFPLNILSLPSRNDLNVSIQLLYLGNVERDATTWNLEAPTGIVGLGWALPYQRIVVDNKRNACASDEVFYLDQDGQTEQLIAITRLFPRGRIADSYASCLRAGAVDSAIRVALAGIGLRIGPDARMRRGAAPSEWHLYDDTHKRIFRLAVRDSGVIVTTDGESFELANYRFWQVTYYRDYERWEIVKEDGSISSYGGEGQSIRDGQPSNVLQWGIRWESNWQGPSMAGAGQQRFVTAWNLARVENPQGDFNIYNYQMTEQKVGDGTLTYTKECHVLEVQNDLGWSCRYAYAPKIYDNSALDAPKEYLDPNKDPSRKPDTTPDAYQSRYDTLYLDRLSLLDAEGAAQLHIELGYFDELRNVTVRDPRNPLANGATYKRYLKSITQRLANGQSKPGPQFEYDFTTDLAANRGALTRILYPTGSIVSFAYDVVSVGADVDADPGARNLTIANPFGANVKNPARIWNGGDYVVCGWYNIDLGRLKLNVFTWIGRWHQWLEDWLDFDGDFNIEALQIAPGLDSFLLALSYAYTMKTDVYLFRRMHLCDANWVLDTDGAAPRRFTYQTKQLGLGVGNDFFLVNDQENKRITRFGWTWPEQAWQVDELADKATLCQSSTGSSYTYYVAAHNNYYLLLCYDTTNQISQLTVTYRDPQLQWIRGGTLQTSDIRIPKYNVFSYFAFAPSDSFAAMAFIDGYTAAAPSDFSAFRYQVKVLTWDVDYLNLAFAPIEGFDQNNFINIPKPLLNSIGPLVLDNALVGAGPNLCVFDGRTWRYRHIAIHYDSKFPDPANQYYWYTYSDCACLHTENTNSGVFSQLSSQDPSAPAQGWIDQTLEDVSPPPAGHFRDGYPTLVGTYLTQGITGYNRSVYPSWSGIERFALGTLPGSGIDSTTIINQAPNFLAFMRVDADDNPLESCVAFFKNGGFIRAPESDGAIVVERFEGQQMVRMLGPQHRYRSTLAGEMPAIPFGFFTLPAKESIDGTTQVTLHRYANHAMRGPIHAFVVKSIATDNGYEQLAKCYDYADATAAMDATGSIVRFQTVSEFDGCDDPADQSNGYTVSHFYNGLPPEHVTIPTQAGTAPVDHYSMLDGMVVLKQVFDAAGRVITSNQSNWTVVSQVATDPAGTQLRRMYGGLPQITSTVSSYEGVVVETTSEYSLASGNTVRSVSSYYGSTGEKIIQKSLNKYAYEEYPDMWLRNILTATAQVTSQSKFESDADFATQSVSVQTYQEWPAGDGRTYWDIYENFSPKTTAAPPFTWWLGGAPDGWLLLNRISRRDAYGHILEAFDVDGRATTNVYDDSQTFMVATFKNATIAENGVCYDSFEDYQTTEWRVVAGPGGVIHDDAFTGENCLALSGDGAVEKTVALGRPNGTYVFSCWIKTPSGVTADQVSVRARIAAPGGGGAALTRELAATDGEWTNTQWVADLGLAGDATLTLRIEAAFDGAATTFLRIDDVFFSPLDSFYNGFIYDGGKLYQTSTVAANGVSSRTFYNLFDAPCAGAGAYANITSIQSAYYVAQTAAVAAPGEFPRSTPNSALQVGARAPGFYDLFRADALDRYDFVNSAAADWRTEAGELQLVGSSSTALGAQVQRKGFAARSMAVNVHLEIDPGAYASLGTGRYFMVWNGSRWQLVVSRGGQVSVLSENGDTGFHRDWMFVVFDDRVMAYADGIRIFNYRDPAVAGEHAVMLGLKQPGALAQLLVAEDINLSITYFDGSGNNRQSVHMEDGGAVILNANIYDRLGRAPVIVKPSRVTTAHVADPFAYYDQYVTNASPDGSLWQGAPMEGPAASTYHPEDGGYPFAREVYEPAPTQRLVKLGQPGKDFAIAVVDGVENPHITRMSYGVNDGSETFLYPLPPGQYPTTTTADPDGNTGTAYADASGHGIGNIVRARGGEIVTQQSAVYDVFGRSQAQIPPAYYGALNYQRPPGDPVIPPSAVTFTYNDQNLPESTFQPDRGTTRYLYDHASRLRFTQDSSGVAGSFFQYVTYDNLGRPREEGYVYGAWDAALADKALNEPGWPAPADTWSSRFSYDGDGSTPNMVGQLYRSFANNAGTREADVKQTFAYTRTGAIARKTVEVAAFAGSGTQSLAYTYNANGSVLTVSDKTTGVIQINSYNALDQVLSVSAQVGDETTVLARFTYNQEGQLEAISSLPDGGAPLPSTHIRYNSPGWPRQMGGGNLSESLDYTRNACDGGGYYTGAIAYQTLDYMAGQPRSKNSCFSVDALNRLVTANADGDTNSWALDTNGNITSEVRNGVTREFVIAANGNRLNAIASTDPAWSRSYAYTDNGQLTTARHDDTTLMTLSYFKGSGQVDAVALPGGTEVDAVGFLYDAGAQRVLKTASKAGVPVRQTLYVNGNGGPLLQIVSDGGSERTSRYIYGPGLAVIYSGGRFYFVLGDHLNSARMIIDHANIVVGEYDYDIYGRPTVIQVPPFDYDRLFTGQFFDRELGLYWYKSRFYDPGVGRFIMFDPALEVPSPYCYVRNNPMMWTDPSGMVSSGAVVAVVGGVVMVGAGVALTLATMGSAAPLLVTGSLVGAALIGGGISSISYAATHRGNNFSVRGWALNVGIGMAAGFVSAGAGMGIGAVGSAAASTVTNAASGASFAARTALRLIGSAATGAATGGIGNAAGTLAANAIQRAAGDNVSLWQGVGVSFATGTVFGAVSGFCGGMAGLRAGMYRQYRPTGESIRNFDNAGINLSHKGTATGTVDTRTGTVYLEDFEANDDVPYSVGHAQQTLKHGLITKDKALFPVNEDAQPYCSGHEAQGFSLQFKSGPNRSKISFNSTFLNYHRNIGSSEDMLMPRLDRVALMSSLRYSPGLCLRPTTYAYVTNLEKVIAFFLRNSL